MLRRPSYSSDRGGSLSNRVNEMNNHGKMQYSIEKNASKTGGPSQNKMRKTDP